VELFKRYIAVNVIPVYTFDCFIFWASESVIVLNWFD